LPSWGRYAAEPLLVEMEKTALLSGTAIAAAPLMVPAGERWIVLWLCLRWIASANAGNRQLAYQLRDESNVVLFALQNGTSGAAFNQTASQGINWFYQSRNVRDVVVSGGTSGFGVVNQFFPAPFVLGAGQDIRFFDNSNIDGAGDTARGSAAILRVGL
jgi:hypothetical protein